MSVKFYMDLMSQPTRALYIFMKVAGIPFEKKVIDLRKGEHYEADYEKINRFCKVPAIEHNGFTLIESVAIVRYLAREFQLDNHWYPKDSKAQAKVDEYLEWQHLNTRFHCASYFQLKYLLPRLKKEPSNPKTLVEHEARLVDCLNGIENIWLKDSTFLIGNQISVADLFAACEIEQLRVCDFNIRNGRPKLSAWLDLVGKETQPHYEEAHLIINKVVKKNKDHSKL